MANLFANSEDPDQTPHSAASDLGLHCLPNTLLRVSWLQWANVITLYIWTLKFSAILIIRCQNVYVEICLKI